MGAVEMFEPMTSLRNSQSFAGFDHFFRFHSTPSMFMKTCRPFSR